MPWVDKGESPVSDSQFQGGQCSLLQMVYGGCTCLLCTGFILIIVGVSALSAATVDTRGQKMVQFETAMNAWNSGGAKNFQATTFQVQQGNRALTLQKQTQKVAPVDYGETSFNDPKGTKTNTATPDQLTDYKFAGTATGLDLGRPGPKSLTVTSKKGNKVVSTYIVKDVGVRTTENKFGMCGYYDSDYYHPMMTAGLGCQQGYGQVCRGPNNAKAAQWKCGPKCVEVDQCQVVAGNQCCPNDMIIKTYLTQRIQFFQTYYGTQAMPVVQQNFVAVPRFQYDPSDNTCTDWDDCRCVGCGFVFKTDIKAGTMFSNTGYMYPGPNGRPIYTPYSSINGYNNYRSFNGMPANAQATMCRHIIESWMGRTCTQKVKYQCFAAGGWPKQTCQNYCAANEGTYVPRVFYPAQVQRTSTVWNQMTTYYPQYGRSVTTTQPTQVTQFVTQWFQTQPTCTTGTKVTSVTVNVNSQGTITTGPIQRVRWNTKTPVPTTIAVSTGYALDGPIRKMQAITDCKFGNNKNKCFGNTQAENAKSGIMYLVMGLILFCLPMVVIGLLCSGLLACLKK